MKLGIHVSNTRAAGGQFQVLVMMLDALSGSDIAEEVFLIYFDDADGLGERFAKNAWQAVDLRGRLSLAGELGDRAELAKHVKPILRDELQLDYLLLPTWTDQAWDWGVPTLLTVHDLQHRLQPEFPEVSMGKEFGLSWMWREEFFQQHIAAAARVLVDSEEGKRHVFRFYDCPEEKIAVLPYTVPSSSRQSVSSTTLDELRSAKPFPDRYFFYPAQLWPHKNHYRVVEAVCELKKRGEEVHLVLTGGSYPDWPILDVCQALAERAGVSEQIHYLGYVSDKELAALYQSAVGLVMPTFFGPTNIPYLEAFYHGCPVIASDLPGIREQVGRAALLVDPKETLSIADAMEQLWGDAQLCGVLKGRGREQLLELSPERFQARLLSILSEISREV